MGGERFVSLWVDPIKAQSSCKEWAAVGSAGSGFPPALPGAERLQDKLQIL